MSNSTAHDAWVKANLGVDPAQFAGTDLSGAAGQPSGAAATGSPPAAPPPPPPPGPDPSKQFYDRGYEDGSLGGVGVCPAHADAAGEAAYNRGYGDGKKALERRRRAQKIADDSVSGDSHTSAEDTGLIAQHMAAKMPLKEMEALQKAGIKVKVTRGNVTNYLTELKGVHPRDYPGDSVWDKVPGTYWAPTKEIVIATQDAGGGKRKLPGADLSTSEDVFEHESAHALNRTGTAGLLSDADDFKSAYEKDGNKGKFAQEYYHQKGPDGKDSSAGRDEAFAESNAMYITDPDKLKRECPNLYEYWHKMLAD
ncbi:MAG: hypothetical protein JO047_13560 [Alphaproteobacteria bacterium]|nr:hypothetical protein [Alphaproteobacteria bacterium]